MTRLTSDPSSVTYVANPDTSLATIVLSRDIVYGRVAAQDFFVVWGVDV
ncbi:hypothetical protein [Microbacterium luticocti]|nr:hypothetical protein [Microbacterium luticocti]